MGGQGITDCKFGKLANASSYPGAQKQTDPLDNLDLQD
jgi:hypothetical protein